MNKLGFAVLAGVCISSGLGAQQPPTPDALLQRAFDARYECTITGVIEIETRKGEMAAMKRRMDVATKSIENRLHTYAVFREPQYVRGVAFLGIEAAEAGKSEERFVYLPSLRKIRRVSGSQSEDAFLGTDLSYHDFERQRGANYDVALEGQVTEAGENAWVISARPHRATGYAAVEHVVAVSDFAILATRYFKKDTDAPYKELWMSRDRMIERGSCRVPTRIRVEDRQRGTSTVLDMKQLRLDAELPDDLFSMVSLETKRKIPGI
jgi:hypothetical protein